MITVVVATYGNDEWKVLAQRAAASARAQADEVIVVHQPDGTLATARNAGAKQAKGDFLIHLDGDDELEPGYVDAMRAAIVPGVALYAPQVAYVIKGKRQPPKYWREVSLIHGNWLVIGTMLNRHEFLQCGGFKEWSAYEDYELFARYWRDHHAQIVRVPHAVYRAHWRQGSRNKQMTRQEAVELHYEIGSSLFPEHYPETWLRQHLPRR